MKNICLLLFSILVLFGCSSVPKYSNRESLVVFPVNIQKDNPNYQFYLHYLLCYKEVFSNDDINEKVIYYIPTSQKYILAKIPEGSYIIDTIFPIRVSDRAKLKAYSLNLPFECNNGQINYTTFQLDVSVKQGIDKTVEQRISYSPVDPALLSEIRDILEKDSNAKKWIYNN